ncbi:MAG TPA: DMT family transporter [Candidatus Desulfovibrio intestinavium]|uniref:DMT family transporter n=1 Tax=Candidatus Desulfovibrio intestinavium TaxID=2838534 RepID=A0A9D2HLH3_9BACT|nr:DMT family transporter [Candidatus Desulfovibrio intestinavium]
MGFFYGLFSSATFGLIPFFSIPLMRGGMSAECALFYRFLVASLTLWLVLRLRGERVRAPLPVVGGLCLSSFFYLMAALLLFWSFHHMPSGMASTIQFLYPVQVMLIMVCFFHERFSWITAAAIALAVAGVYMLGGDGGSGALSLLGLGMALLSSLCNALYIIGLQITRKPGLSGLAVTFWVLAAGAAMSLVSALLTGSFRLLVSVEEGGNVLGLAIITALLSNLTLVLAVQRIGSTLTSVLGVMEPLTAVIVGILVFHEPCTAAVFSGVGLICGSVLLVMLGPQVLALVRRRA